MPTSSEVREWARQGLRGKWGKAIAVGLLYMIIVGGLGAVPYVGWVATFLLAGPLSLGMYTFFIRLIRRGEPSVSVLFDGFNRFGSSFALYILIQVFVLLWSLLLIIPGIIASFRYSQAYFIMQDNPQVGALEALRQSKQMMIGHKGRLFVLYLTFIGWALLAALTFGIGYIWLMPYIVAAQAAFYEDLKMRSTPPTAPPNPNLV